MRHAPALAFLVGGAVGAGVALLADAPPAPADARGPTAPPAAAPARPVDEPVDLAADLADAALTDELDRALFERSWARVEAVATVLRGRAGAPPGDAAPGAGPDAPARDEGPTLARLEHDFRQALTELELARRDTPASRLAAAGLPPDELEARLRALWDAQVTSGDEALTRRDAARWLARLGTDGARRALTVALEGPDPQLADEAAQALALAPDRETAALLLGVARDARDPAVRWRALAALADSPHLVRRDGAVAGALARAAREDPDPEVRRRATGALARADLARADEARAALVRLATDEAEDLPLRRAAVAALREHTARRGSPGADAEAALADLFARATGALRGDVALALAETGDADTRRALEEALRQATDPAERAALAQAIDALRRRVVAD